MLNLNVLPYRYYKDIFRPISEQQTNFILIPFLATTNIIFVHNFEWITLLADLKSKHYLLN